MLIRVVDLETTGLAPPASVCEIGWANLDDGFVYEGGAVLVDPGQPIPPETSAIHHIVDADVCGAPLWPDVAKALLSMVNPSTCILAAHNARFERQWLTDAVTGGLQWICTYKCALRLWPDAPGHSNQTLRYWRNPVGLDRNIANMAHRAGPDAYVTAFLLRDMLALAPVDQLIEWSGQPALLVKCGFGKHFGKPWSEVPTDYLAWASRQDMDEDVLFTVRHEMARRKDRP